MAETDKNTMDQEKAILSKVKVTLDTAAQDLDAVTRSRLRAIRREALTSVEMKDSQSWWVPATSLAAVATLMVLTISLWTIRPDTHSTLPSLEDIALLTDQEDPDLYEHLDFYLWLDTEQLKREKIFNEQKTG